MSPFLLKQYVFMVSNTLMNSLLSLRQEKQLSKNVSSTQEKSGLVPRHSWKDLPATHTEFSCTRLRFLILDGNSKCRTAEHYDTGRHFFLLSLSKTASTCTHKDIIASSLCGHFNAPFLNFIESKARIHVAEGKKSVFHFT